MCKTLAVNYLFNKIHVTIIFCKGAIRIFSLHCNNRTSFFELQRKDYFLFIFA